MHTILSNAEDIPKQINSWNDIAIIVEHFSYFSAHDWLFRGVTETTHNLIPKIGRPETRAIKENISTKNRVRVRYRQNDECAVFQMFKQQARSYLTQLPANDIEWLAVAQHFGLPTRLLDWTESFLIAVWFAVEKAGAKPSKANSAVWVTYRAPPIEVTDMEKPFESKEPKIYRPAYVSPRIAAQASVLMLCPDPTKNVIPNHIQQITIDRNIEFLLKKRLNACGINKRALFPDLSGLAEHLSWLHKHDYLAGYRAHDASSIDATLDDTPQRK